MNQVHDTPLIGHVSLFFTASMGDAFGFGAMTDEQYKEKFDEIDKDKSGTLDRGEIAEALRKLGKSEREIQKVIENIDEEFEGLNFEQFKELFQKKAQPLTHDVGGYSVPNLAKIHDIPVLGAFTGATHDLVKGAASGLTGVAFSAAFGGLTDEQMKEKFDEIDTDKSGALSGKELGVALRKLKLPEADIKSIMEQVGEKELSFDDFKHLVKPMVGQKSVHDTPGVGHFTQFFASSFGGAFGFGKMTPEEIDKAFKEIDKDGSGKLDKTELADALRKLKKSEREIQQLLSNMEEAELDPDEFKALIEGKAQSYTTNVAGMPLPNLAKVHDVPFLGAFTSAAHGLAGGIVDASWNFMGGAFGAAFGNIHDVKKLREKFDEIDTDHSGKLNAKEIAVALRHFGSKEADIKQITISIGKEEVDFEGFKKLVGFKEAKDEAKAAKDGDGEKAAENGEKAAENGEKAAEDGEKAAESGEKAAEDGQ